LSGSFDFISDAGFGKRKGCGNLRSLNCPADTD